MSVPSSTQQATDYLRSLMQSLPDAAVCWRKSEELLEVYPRGETLFKHAFNTIRFTFAVKMPVQAISTIFVRSPYASTISIGLGQSIPVIQSTANISELDRTKPLAAIIRDEQALVVWSQDRLQDVIAQWRVLEHRLQHTSGSCCCQDFAELPTDMLPFRPDTTPHSPNGLLDDVPWPVGGADPFGLCPSPTFYDLTSPALTSLSELPTLYGFAGSSSLFDLSLFTESNWFDPGFACTRGPGSLWDDEVVYRSSAAADTNKPSAHPTHPPHARPANRSPSPISSPSPSASSSSPPPTSSSSCTSSTMTTPHTVCLSDISPAPPPAPPLVDTDSEMSDPEDDAEGDSDDSSSCDSEAEASSQGSSSLASALLPGEVAARKILPPRSPRPNTSPSAPSSSRAYGQWSTPSSSAPAPLSRKRKSPSPSTRYDPSPYFTQGSSRAATHTYKPQQSYAAGLGSVSPLSDMSELTDPDADYQEADSGDEGDNDESDDDDYYEARRPAKRTRTSGGFGKTASREAPSTTVRPAPRASSPEEDGDKAAGKASSQKKTPRRRRKASTSANAKRKWSCEQCGKKFTRSADAERHMKSACKGVPADQRDQFVCDGRGEGGCGKAFSREDALTRHMKTCKEVPSDVRDALERQSRRLRFD